MANEEHLAILKQGVEVWNGWRERNKLTRPELCRAELIRQSFCGAEIWAADLSSSRLCETELLDADISSAALSMADLRDADLSGATLRAANLTQADLLGANLTGTEILATNLAGANLSRADLTGANLNAASLGGANLNGAKLYLTILADVDPSQVRGLDTVTHTGPLIIGIDTLLRSRGDIPESFLRGCGVPDQFIEYARSLVGKAIEYYSCFIGYSSKDEECAQRLHADLQANNVRCWFAPHDLPIGARIRPDIDDAIRLHDTLLLILSETSVVSQWVEEEVERALQKEQENPGSTVLFPIRLDDAAMRIPGGWSNYLRNTRNIGDFTRWKDHDEYAKVFQRLLRGLKATS